ncbi:hypothetical protein UFOVP257_401 [uncultured Caudovirales phage]|uniref:Uncharacterized protein n=1 Tax=uncultured Caudovirales phage TaxID=2100421 RepID=A0A6J5LPQ4_9CAUD|nr:hypothetical protein UFOVP257_401 [uncultured Caudovirales phage]
MKYDYVLSFGDSTVAGTELIFQQTPTFLKERLLPLKHNLDIRKDADIQEDQLKEKELSFSNTLAKKFGIPCINFAIPAGSNDRNLRLLPEALLKYPNSLVLFNYSYADRSELFMPDSPAFFHTDSDDYIQLTPSFINGPSFDIGSKKYQELIKTWITDFYNIPDNYNRFKTYNMLLTVELLCKHYAKNFTQIFLYDRILLEPNFQKETYSTIDKNYIFKFDIPDIPSLQNKNFGSLQRWAETNKYPTCAGGHIGQKAHDEFANLLYDYFK